MYVLIFILAVGLFVMVHEAGHFLTARLFGMRVSEFFVGFGPRITSFRRGETEYGIKAIPAGGYVKIIGMNAYEEVEEADRGRTFWEQPLWQRLVVLVAGSVTHFILAFLLIVAGLVLTQVPLTADGQPARPGEGEPTTTVQVVVADTPADAAGIVAGDVIVAVDGTRVTTFQQVRDALRPLAGETIDVTVNRDGAERVLTTTLPDRDPQGEDRGFLGVSPRALTGTVPLGTALREASTGFYSLPSITAVSIEGLGRAFSPAGISAWLGQLDGGERTAEGPISLVGAAQVTSALGRQGEIFGVLVLLANLNIVLGIVNLLPLPPLDGGHVATALVEDVVRRVRRRRGLREQWHLNPQAVLPIAAAVFLFFAVLSLTALFIDIVNPASQLLE